MNTTTLRTTRTLLSASALGLASLALIACDNEPAKGKPVAEVAAPIATTERTPSAGSALYTFSNEGSEVTFVGAKVTKKHDGAVSAFKGSVDLVDGDPTKSAAKVEIEMTSISADDPKLTGHLKSPDFFDVEKFPKGKFTTTQVKAGGANGASHTVTGNLELHGVTKSITFPATIRPSADKVEVDAEFAINRKDFGIVYPGMPDDLIKNDVLIKLKLRAKKQLGS